MIWITVAGVLVALAALAGGFVYLARAVLARNEAPTPVREPTGTGQAIEWLTKAQKEQGRRMDDLELAVAEGIRGVTRERNRINKTVGSARRLLRENGLEHPALESEYEDLQPVDAEPREAEQLQLVPQDVASTGPSGIPGVTLQDLDRARENYDRLNATSA